MNIFQKILGTIFPPYKFKIIREEESKLLNSIVNALPEKYKDIKASTENSRLLGLNDWELHPGFKTLIISCSEEVLLNHRKRGENYKIQGIEIYSKEKDKYENVEILVRDNMISAIKISNSSFLLKNFDLMKINIDNISKSDFEFPPNDIDIFYNSLDNEIKDILKIDDLFDIDFNNKTFFAFYDLEDGNYLAVDKKEKVYSLVHDAKPMAKTLKYTFIEILREISENKFNKEKHLEERYKNSK